MISEAVIRVLNRHSQPGLSFKIATSQPALKTQPDTETLRATPEAEFFVAAPGFSWDTLVGRSWKLPKGYDARMRDYVTRFHYRDEEETDDNVIEVLENQGQAYRVRITGTCGDVVSQDESQPRTRITIDAWFTPPRWEPVYSMSRFDRVLRAALVSLTAFVCISQYLGGRLEPAILVVGMAVHLLLVFIVAPIYAYGGLLPSYAGRRLQQLGKRVLFITAVFALGMLPAYCGYGLIEMGLRHHIQSVFTPAVVAEVRALAETKLTEHPAGQEFKLATADLPPRIGATTWGFPRRSTVRFGINSRDLIISLEWSDHIASHGIVLSDVPFHNDDEGDSMSPRYTPWVDHSYIFTWVE